jgi:predicted nicotinamide N-methyase
LKPGDPHRFIVEHLRLAPVTGLADLLLYQAHSGSHLSELAPTSAAPPYWAYPWAGGLALAQHFAAHPESVSGKRVLDLGAGSGLVGIAAGRAGAASVLAADIDPPAHAAIALNAAANGVSITLCEVDLHETPPPVDLIVAGDVFYEPGVAALMLPFLRAAVVVGIDVLIGDPQRRDLPTEQLAAIASYPVGDVGDVRMRAERVGWVYRLSRD